MNIFKDEENELPIPIIWRGTFYDIVEALKDSDIDKLNNIAGVIEITFEDLKRMNDNIVAYGDNLTSLSETTWESSTCIWYNEYWKVIIDLNTIQQKPSDLSLFSKIYEDNNNYYYELEAVYVP